MQGRDDKMQALKKETEEAKEFFDVMLEEQKGQLLEGCAEFMNIPNVEALLEECKVPFVEKIENGHVQEGIEGIMRIILSKNQEVHEELFELSIEDMAEAFTPLVMQVTEPKTRELKKRLNDND